ncbi:MAG: MotA/TolQ/ExbB proton channel family protein, partial [Calditrichia bacterium]|nr:MotA/TolQ/ExbB proton channel family protein [Calditrichia bacterium]
MLEIIKSGGILMYPLLLSSIIAVSVIIDKILNLRKNKVLPPEIIAVSGKLKNLEDMALTEAVCNDSNSPLSKIVLSCIKNSDLSTDNLRKAIEDEGKQQVTKLRKGLIAIDTVASAAPLLGLLGTIIGMIEVFNVIQEMGVGQATALSGGISQALITTATGLFIGIPALIANNYFNGRIKKLVLAMERHISNILN